MGDTKRLEDDDRCFACGSKNPIGLRMEVSFEEGVAFSTVTLKKDHQGWKGVAHGGIVSTLMDEVMAHAVIRTAGTGVTGSIDIRFRAPVPIEEPLRAEGRVENARGQVAITSARLLLEETGEVLAEAKGRFVLQSGSGEDDS